MQDPDPPLHPHPRVDLQARRGRPDTGSDGDRIGVGVAEGLDGEGGGHVLRAAAGDLSGGDEHEADLVAGVGELEGAVVVGEFVAVRVSDGDELGEGEVDGAVRDGEGGELEGVNGDLGFFGFEEGEEDDEDDDGDEDEEDGGDDAGGKVGSASRGGGIWGFVIHGLFVFWECLDGRIGIGIFTVFFKLFFFLFEREREGVDGDGESFGMGEGVGSGRKGSL